ncbi:MAG: aminotransferase class V-fold PLP-dependent enzyme, partial [Bacteroidia bacterium]
ACIEFMQQHNWTQVSKDCLELTLRNIPRFAEILDAKPLVPVNSGMYGQMCSMPVKTNDPNALRKKLYEEHNIEISAMMHNGQAYMRYSIQAFNTQDDLDRLFDVLEIELSK